jgi:hypothetical protein
MIKSFVAFTEEIDNAEAAAAELTAQISESGKLCKNTVGIVHCHCEFLTSGAYETIAEVLPFPLCGITTSINGGGNIKNSAGENGKIQGGELFFTLLVLSSDDVSFEIGVSEKIAQNGGYDKAFQGALKCGEKPKLVTVWAPSIEVIPGDDLVAAFDKAMPGVPLFGGYSVDDSPRYNENVYSLANGEFFRDRVVFLKIFGSINPRFYTASISKEKINANFAVVTQSSGNEIISLNGRPVLEFLETIGLSETIIENGIVTNYALVLDGDTADSYYARAMLSLTKDKTLICAGVIPQGAQIRIGQFDKTDTIASGRSAAVRAFAEPADVVLTLSSISRATILGADVFHGINTVQNSATSTYTMVYAAGEICPVTGSSGTKNRFNNQSFNACAM